MVYHVGNLREGEVKSQFTFKTYVDTAVQNGAVNLYSNIFNKAQFGTCIARHIG